MAPTAKMYEDGSVILSDSTRKIAFSADEVKAIKEAKYVPPTKTGWWLLILTNETPSYPAGKRVFLGESVLLPKADRYHCVMHSGTFAPEVCAEQKRSVVWGTYEEN